MPSAARSDGTYPPLDSLKPVAEDVWIVDSGPLHALRSGEDGGNGVYRYGGGGVLPTGSWNASNYWIDIAFQEGQ